jgi:tetratricopeptide (TPR) repeat protein
MAQQPKEPVMHHRIILILTLAFAAFLHAGPVEDASLLLQQQRYQDAATKLTDAVINAEKDAGYAHYLRAVALSESKQHAKAITDCDAVPAGHAWQRKALFLKAQCLAELKRHQEAEAIYSAEATRLFATVRKEKLAESLVVLAQEITKPVVPGQSVSGDAYNKALALYRKALELETGPTVRENLLFQSAAIIRRIKKHQEFPAACDAYLREFDPDWRGLTGSEAPKTPAKETGARRWEVRAMLIENLLVNGAGDASRVYAEDMLKLWKTKPPAAGTKPDIGELEWLLCRSHGASAYREFDPPQIAQGSNDMQQGTFQRQQVAQRRAGRRDDFRRSRETCRGAAGLFEGVSGACAIRRGGDDAGAGTHCSKQTG